MDPSLAKRVWNVIRAARCMIRKGFSKHRLIVELHLLLKRGKLAGKAIGKLLLHHQHHHAEADAAGFPLDPVRFSFCRREDVEFSCSSTPSPAAATFFLSKRRPGQHRGDCAAAMLTREFEALMRASPSPSPAAAEASLFEQSPAGEQLRIADSPFPETEEEEAAGRPVDRDAEAFISWFREQLRLQRSVPATPECRGKAAA